MGKFEELRSFVQARLPVLNKEMEHLSNDEVRQVLNAATGLNVRETDPIGSTAGLYVAEMRKHEVRGTLLLSVLPLAIREIVRLRKLKQSHFGE